MDLGSNPGLVICGLRLLIAICSPRILSRYSVFTPSERLTQFIPSGCDMRFYMLCMVIAIVYIFVMIMNASVCVQF